MSPLILPDLLRARAAEDPDGVALRVGEGTTLTLGAWERRSNAAARGLVGRGVRPGDRVALLFDGSGWADYAVAYLAVHKAGAVAVPLGSRFAGRELDRILDHAEPVGIVGRAHGARWAAGLEELEEGHVDESFQITVDPKDLAEILYTSGTTGRPKGVACSHLGIMAHDVPPDGAAATVAFLHGFPIGTQAGQETLRVPLRIAGRTAIAVPHFDPDVVSALVARHHVARLQLVPAMAQVLVGSPAVARHDLTSVRRVILSSAHAPPALFARLAETFPSATLWNAYALTEGGSARTLGQWDEARPSSVGRPVGETEVRIAGPDGLAAGPGQVGEVWLRRRGTPTRTYYRDPAATAEVFVDGWVRTGDLGHLDGEGLLHLDDRIKDLIISGGTNISSVEVEDVLGEHPDVVAAAVFGLAHPVLGEEVAAAVVVSGTVTPRQLRDFVRGRLAEHKVPRRLVLVDDLPRNASGKVVKGELRQRYDHEPETAPYVAPSGAVEPVVAAIWAEVLGLPRVGADDDFFGLGGHSLAAAQIATRLADALGRPVPVADVFEAPTVAELAQRLARAATPDEAR
ncbi:MAG: non-ribosomal peptide synthetase [Acidimicrobiales bacterium]